MSVKSVPFRIYYHDRQPYDGLAWLAPAFGVLVIVERDTEHGRRLVHNGDFYAWDALQQRWWPLDFSGLLDYLACPGPRKVLFGRLVSNTDFAKTYRKAEADPHFPLRTAHGRLHSKVR